VSAESRSTAKWSPSATIMLFRHAGQGISRYGWVDER
jgi:hypothetical protein